MGGGGGEGSRALIQHFDLLAKQSEIHKIRHKMLIWGINWLVLN